MNSSGSAHGLEAEAIHYYQSHQPFRGNVAELQAKLLAYGYDTPQTGVLDTQTINVVAAFQMHFRPGRYDGAPDIETAAILDALLEKYFRRGRRAQQRQAVPGQRSPRGEKGDDMWPTPDTTGQSSSPSF